MQVVNDATGRFVWFELMTTDVEAAIAFYGKVVGWTTESWGSEGGYRMWKTAAGPHMGGVMTLPEEAKAMGAPPHWMGNLCVASVDTAVEQVKSLGGAVYQGPFDIPQIGRVAIVADPAGASLALYQPEGQAPGHSEEPRPGEVSWCELASSDVDAAWNFYATIGGWQKTEAMDMGPMGTYQMYGPATGGTIGGMMTKPEQMPVSAWQYYFYVENLDTAIATAVENGGTLLHGPQEVPGGSRVANLLDPQGACFALHGPAAVQASA